MNNTVSFNHEKLLEEITLKIEDNINFELDESSDSTSDDSDYLELKFR